MIANPELNLGLGEVLERLSRTADSDRSEAHEQSDYFDPSVDRAIAIETFRASLGAIQTREAEWIREVMRPRDKWRPMEGEYDSLRALAWTASLCALGGVSDTLERRARILDIARKSVELVLKGGS